MLIGGSAGAVAGQVEMAIEEVLEIAKSTVADIEDTAQNRAARPFRDLEVERSAYSEVPAAQDLGGQHEAVKQVFMETIEAVVADLAEFKQRLLDSAQTMQQRDQSAEQMLLSLGRSYEGHQFASDATYLQGRVEHADALAAPQATGADAAADAAPVDAAAAAAESQTQAVAADGQASVDRNF